jgi:7,8-dihydro-6-hydroxymethylpterin-pyrophosphokinase
MGRLPAVRNGPRLIDIDILLYDDHRVELPDLRVPHASLHERRFALAPLAEIAPDAVHAGMGRAVKDLLHDLPAGETVRRCARTEDWPLRTEPEEGSC